MQFIRITLILFALALGGCATTSGPTQVGAVDDDYGYGPQDSEAIPVRAEGFAYMGDKDRLEDVRQRAWEDAVDRAVTQGAGVYVASYRQSEFGAITRDEIRQAVAGTLEDVIRVDEGFEGNRYRVVIEGMVRPGDVESLIAQRQKRTQPISGNGTITDSQEEPAAPESTSSVTVRQLDPIEPLIGGRVSLCCYEFPPRLAEEVYPALARAPGITRIERDDTSSGALCYRLSYSGRMDELESWLRRELRSTPQRTFRLVQSEDPARIRLVFDGGFE